MQVERIGVCGLGKVGSVIHKVFTDAGLSAVGYDSDPAKSMCSDVPTLVANTDACIFIVPTPSLPDGTFDNSHIAAAIDKVAYYVREAKRYDYLFIVSSTTTPGSCQSVLLPLLPPGAGLVYKPEFIAMGSVERDMTHPDLVLVGESTPWAGHAAATLYSRIVKDNHPAAVRRMTMTEAELAKITVNCGVTMKISFANQVGMVAQAIGCDPWVVLDAVGCDHRIGGDYLRPGLPFGGPCFPRDNKMFRTVAYHNGVYAMLAMATDLINEEMRNRVLGKLVGGRTPVGILGLAYKPGTPVTEESLGEWLQTKLNGFVCENRAYDPVAPCPNTLEEVMACPTVVIACPHPEFATYVTYPSTCDVIDPWGLLRK